MLLLIHGSVSGITTSEHRNKGCVGGAWFATIELGQQSSNTIIFRDLSWYLRILLDKDFAPKWSRFFNTIMGQDYDVGKPLSFRPIADSGVCWSNTFKHNLAEIHELWLTDHGVENFREPNSRRLLGYVLKKTKVALSQKLYGFAFLRKLGYRTFNYGDGINDEVFVRFFFSTLSKLTCYFPRLGKNTHRQLSIMSVRPKGYKHDIKSQLLRLNWFFV